MTILAVGLMLAAGLLPTVLAGLGWAAAGLIVSIVLLALGSGRLICRLLGAGQDPFLALVAGYVLIAYSLVLGDLVSPGVHPVIVVAILPLALGGFLSAGRVNRASFGLALAVAAATAAWCIDVAPRMAAFRATGRFDFWIDFFVHAGNIAQFEAPTAVGRGMMLLADVPAPFYHYASLLPISLLGVSSG